MSSQMYLITGIITYFFNLGMRLTCGMGQDIAEKSLQETAMGAKAKVEPQEYLETKAPTRNRPFRLRHWCKPCQK